MSNALKYFLIGLCCALWALRFGVTAPQGNMFFRTVQDIPAVSPIPGIGEWLPEGDHAVLIAALYNDVSPFHAAERAESASTPCFRINPHVRFISVPDGVLHIHSDYLQQQVRAQYGDRTRVRALKDAGDYHLYALRKIII